MKSYLFTFLFLIATIASINYQFLPVLTLQILYFLGNADWVQNNSFSPSAIMTVLFFVILINKKYCIFNIGTTGVFILILSILFYASSFNAVYSKQVVFDNIFIFLKLFISYYIFYKASIHFSYKFIKYFYYVNIFGAIYFFKSLLIGHLTNKGARIDTSVGQGGGANYIAMVYSMIYPYLLVKLNNGKKFYIILSYALILMLIAGLAITGSRAGFIAFFLVTIFIYLKYRKLRIKIIFIFLISSIIAILQFSQFVERIQNIDDTKTGSSAERLLLWSYSIDVIKNNPLFGIGLNNFQFISDKKLNVKSNISIGGIYHGLHVHNTYLQLAAESGLVSLVIFLFLLIHMLIIYKKLIISSENQDQYDYYNAIFGGILAYCVCAMFGSILFRDIFYWYIGALQGLLDNKLRCDNVKQD